MPYWAVIYLIADYPVPLTCRTLEAVMFGS